MIKMNVALYNKLQAELAKKGCRVCGEDIGGILISDTYRIDYKNMKIYTELSKKYMADIVPIKK